jgi:hypothetical protein
MVEKERSSTHDKNDNPPKIPICYFCEEVTDEDHYCFGCGHYVCDNCDEDTQNIGDHNVEDHQDEEEEENEEEEEE